jgi:hypothetical protein
LFTHGFQIPLLNCHYRYSQRGCGTSISASQIKAAEAHFAANKVVPTESFAALAATVSVHFHVVAAGTTLAQGYVP